MTENSNRINLVDKIRDFQRATTLLLEACSPSFVIAEFIATVRSVEFNTENSELSDDCQRLADALELADLS